MPKVNSFLSYFAVNISSVFVGPVEFFFFSFLSRIHPGCKRDVLFTWKGLQRQQQRAEMGGSGL